MHFIRAESLDEALSVLASILRERRLLGAAGFVKGSHRVVCFSEAPVFIFADRLARPESAWTRYQPVGLMLRKAWLFARGGRPVIYQTDEEYASLPESHRWRHVRYDPTGSPPVDFTWEREWRIRADEVPLSPADTLVALPSTEVLEWMRTEHERRQDLQERWNSLAAGEVMARMLREDFPWRCITLGRDDVTATAR